MKTTTTFLAALLLAGASQAALAQEPGHDHAGDRPQIEDHGGGHGGDHHGAGGPAPARAPQAAPQAAPIAPQGGHARFGAPPPPPAGGPALAGAPAPRAGHDGGDRHFDRGGDHNSFAPGGTAPGDRRWDHHEAPREVIPPVNAEHGWDRDHDGHAADGRRLSRDGHDDASRWDRDHNGDHDRDHHGPPPNWRHWQRGQLPPVYAASHRYHVGSYRPPYGWYVRNWGFGDFLPHGWYGSSYWVDDFYDYDLPYPPPGMHWVRVGDDVFLVDDYSGRIVQVIRDMFW